VKSFQECSELLNTNYRHYSAQNLGAIFYNDQEFQRALNFYHLAKTKYPYHNYSGTDIKLNSMRLASRISDCYVELDSLESAVLALLPHGLTTSPNPKNSLTDKILKLVDQYSDRQKFRVDLLQAIEKSKNIQGGIEIELFMERIKLYPYMQDAISKEDLRNSVLIRKLE